MDSILYLIALNRAGSQFAQAPEQACGSTGGQAFEFPGTVAALAGEALALSGKTYSMPLSEPGGRLPLAQ
jgi:hypothetical protein